MAVRGRGERSDALDREEESGPATAATTGTRRAATRWTWLEIAPVLGLVAFAAVFVARASFVVGGKRYFTLFDDAMISMTYARNLASGDGLVWNAGGEAVEGYSNPLWTGVMALAHLPGLDPSKVSLLVVIAALVIVLANIVTARALALRLVPGSSLVGPLTVWLVAAYYPLLFWSARGNEVGLGALLVTLMALLAVRACDRPDGRDPVLLAIVASLAVLTRLDLVVPVVIVVGWLVVRERRAALPIVSPTLLAVGAVLVLHTVFRLVYYDAWLPNTYYLKATGIPLSDRLHRGLGGLVTIGHLELFALLAIAGSWLWARERSLRSSVWLLASLFLGQCAYSAFVGGDAWEIAAFANRFVATGATPLLIVTAFAIADLARSEQRARRPLVISAVTVAVVVVPLRVFDIQPASDLQLGRLPTETWITRVGLPALVVLLIAGTAWAATRGRARPAALASLLLAAALLGTTAREALNWIEYGAGDEADEATARVGLALSELTAPGTTIGVAAAGGTGYFSERETIDLGGKSDRQVARQPPRAGLPFIPGHNKYDYEISLRHDMDVVIGIGATTEEDRRLLRSRGYEELAPRVYVRADATGVNRDGLSRLLSSTAR